MKSIIEIDVFKLYLSDRSYNTYGLNFFFNYQILKTSIELVRHKK
jgi:hypothetical protein